MIEQSGASLAGIVTIIEKTFEGGRALLESNLNIPVIGLVRISSLNEQGMEFAEQKFLPLNFYYEIFCG
ncbi:MAG: hypothetical protein U9N62_09880 [Thermotogota bacterium]|nr:hypothetical protein [Thermotogota bacterium]